MLGAGAAARHRRDADFRLVEHPSAHGFAWAAKTSLRVSIDAMETLQ
jgi:hypothetical protein